MNELTHLDLFAGIGGFTLGFQWACQRAGVAGRTVAFAETDPGKSAWLRSAFPGIPNLGSVRELTREHLAPVGLPWLITGGVPCQPASLLGLRRGTADERWLWPDTVRLVRELRPAFGLFENPDAITTLEGGTAWHGILAAFAEIGYDGWWDVFPAAALGAGHRRRRVYLLVADPHQTRLEGHARHGQDGGRPLPERHPAPPHLHARSITRPQWYAQSGLCPVVDGLPGKLVQLGLQGAGDAVVPQIPELILFNLLSTLEKL